MKASISLKLLYRLRCITFSVRIVPFTVERRPAAPRSLAPRPATPNYRECVSVSTLKLKIKQTTDNAP